MNRVTAIFLVGLLVSGCFRLQSAEKDDAFPAKPITYLVVSNPGGQSDRRARQQQTALERILKRKVIVDYKLGGGGAVGYSDLARSRPDGYTMSLFVLPTIILQPLEQQTGYHTDQFVPVAIFDRTPLGLAVLKQARSKPCRKCWTPLKQNHWKLLWVARPCSVDCT